MRKGNLILVSMQLLVTTIWLSTAQAVETLELSVIEGSAPLVVRIKGPEKLVALGKGQYSKWVGCSYNVDWGDPKHPGTFDRDCGKGLEHTYTSPGSYVVKANIIHPNPDDSHSIDWSSNAKVTVK